MQAAVADMPPMEIYKVMTGSIVPRPIAWITTMSLGGIVNAAPFSAFTYVSQDPPMVLFQAGKKARMKDTARNIFDTGEFVVNIPNMLLLDPMHASSASMPPGISEIETLGIETAPSVMVKPPRIMAAPVSFECVLHKTFELGREPHDVFIGEIKYIHAVDEIYQSGRIDQQKLQPVCRIGGPWYAALGELHHRPAPAGGAE